jgi:hypothetical protein
MLNIIYAEYRKIAHYAECHYAECRYAECRGAVCRMQLLVPALLLTRARYYKTFYVSNLECP